MRAGHDEHEVDPLDAALDRELRAALRVNPSPALAARVRTRIATEPERSIGFWPLAVVGSAVLATIIVGALAIAPREEAPPAVAALASSQPPAVLAAAASATPMTVPPVAVTPRTAGRRVPVAEISGLRELVSLANQGDPSLGSLFAESVNGIAPIEPDEIVIAPITIELLASDTQ